MHSELTLVQALLEYQALPSLTHPVHSIRPSILHRNRAVWLNANLAPALQEGLPRARGAIVQPLQPRGDVVEEVVQVVQHHRQRRDRRRAAVLLLPPPPLVLRRQQRLELYHQRPVLIQGFLRASMGPIFGS